MVNYMRNANTITSYITLELVIFIVVYEYIGN